MPKKKSPLPKASNKAPKAKNVETKEADSSCIELNEEVSHNDSSSIETDSDYDADSDYDVLWPLKGYTPTPNAKPPKVVTRKMAPNKKAKAPKLVLSLIDTKKKSDLKAILKKANRGDTRKIVIMNYKPLVGSPGTSKASKATEVPIRRVTTTRKICSVTHCKSNQLTRGSKRPSVFRLPTGSDKLSLEARQHWHRALGLPEVIKKSWKVQLCEKHFEERCFLQDLHNEIAGLPLRRLLKKGSYPTVGLRFGNEVKLTFNDTQPQSEATNNIIYPPPQHPASHEDTDMTSTIVYSSLDTGAEVDIAEPQRAHRPVTTPSFSSGGIRVVKQIRIGGTTKKRPDEAVGSLASSSHLVNDDYGNILKSLGIKPMDDERPKKSDTDELVRGLTEKGLIMNKVHLHTEPVVDAAVLLE